MIFIVSGVKNSGKTTLIEKLIGELVSRGLKTAVIKHDGHDFEADVPGTDSWRHQKAGAYGTSIFSPHRYFIYKQQPDVTAEDMIKSFPEADIIILEGFKELNYTKIEIVRDGNSEKPVCAADSLVALVTNMDTPQFPREYSELPVYGLEDVSDITDYVLNILRG